MDLNVLPAAPSVIRRVQRPARIIQIVVLLLLPLSIWGSPRTVMAAILAAVTVAFLAECFAGLRLWRLKLRLQAADLRLCPDCGQPLKTPRGREECAACGVSHRSADVEKRWRQALETKAL